MKLLRKTYRWSFGVVILCLFLLAPFQTCLAKEIPAAGKYLKKGGYALNKNGKVISSANSQTPFIPASTIKLVTSLAALEILGSDFRFHTRLYLDKENNLIIQGLGDPFLVSEKVNSIAGLVAEQGITKINNIILDDHAFALEHTTEGSENSYKPYDVNNSALAVNFNSLPFKTLRRAKIKSSESQTPYIPLMGQIGKELTSGYHRVNVDAFAKQQKLSNSLLYCGQLFQAFLARHGVQVQGHIKHGRVTANASPLIDFKANETVSDLVKSCLLSSNNFMANQLYLALGVKKYGFPATWKKSQQTMADFISDNLHLSAKQITMVEGSGLSKKNRVTAKALIEVLERFRDHADLIPIKYGTRMKSGTLRKSGVFCYAGYIPNGQHSSSFVILLNQHQNRRDQILKLLYRQ